MATAESRMSACAAPSVRWSCYAVLRRAGDEDAHAHLGIIATPELQHGTLRPDQDRFIVLASDGVWDVMSEEDGEGFGASSSSRDSALRNRCP